MSKPFVPRPYQEIAISHVLKHLRCAVWLFMGGGKSAVILSALDRLSIVEQVYPALILAPLRVARDTWPDEQKKWTDFSHIKISPIVGSPDERRSAICRQAHIYTCNYENLVWLIDYFGDNWPFVTVIADESIKLKNFRSRQGGKRSGALGKIAFSKIKRFIELTGAPSTGGLLDLFGQLWFLDKGQRLGGTFSAFQQRWFQKGWDGFSVKPLPYAQEQIQEKVKDICLSLDAKDWFDIKKPIETDIYVDLPPHARKLYNDMEKRMYMEIEHEPVEVFNAAARTNKCLQIANGFSYKNLEVATDDDPRSREWYGIHDEKLEAVERIINEAGGASILVAYYFKSDLIRLKKHFPKGRNFDADPKTKKDFLDGKIQVMFIHPGSAGHGVDGLQYVCNTIILMSHDWNLDNFIQLIERIGPVRQIQAGFDRPVYQYNIIARNTMDVDVIRRRHSKKSVQDTLLEATKYREVAI